MRHALRWMASLCSVVMGVGACTHLTPPPTTVTAQRPPAPISVVPPVTAPLVPPANAAVTASAPSAQAPVAVAPSVSPPVRPLVGPPAPGPAPARVAAKVTEKKPVVAAPAVQPAKAPPAAPTLDLAALEQRLRDTHAVGLFTKLSLKNQVDELLDQFRTFYRSQPRTPPTPLRQRYDLLLLKVLTLLQDGDPPLAAAIASSREAIWTILADPQKFASI